MHGCSICCFLFPVIVAEVGFAGQLSYLLLITTVGLLDAGTLIGSNCFFFSNKHGISLTLISSRCGTDDSSIIETTGFTAFWLLTAVVMLSLSLPG